MARNPYLDLNIAKLQILAHLVTVRGWSNITTESHSLRMLSSCCIYIIPDFSAKVPQAKGNNLYKASQLPQHKLWRFPGISRARTHLFRADDGGIALVGKIPKRAPDPTIDFVTSRVARPNNQRLSRSPVNPDHDLDARRLAYFPSSLQVRRLYCGLYGDLHVSLAILAWTDFTSGQIWPRSIPSQA